MSKHHLSLALASVLSGINLYAQEPTYTSPQGIEFILIKPGSMVVGNFKPIFNGKDLRGWHISRTTHQGTTLGFTVEDGVIVGQEKPYGQGGLLLTDKMNKSFEFYAEVKLDSFCNSGLFLRSNEGGSAYQIELVIPGNTGDLLGERITPSVGAKATDREKVWHANDWNSFRVRMEGDIPPAYARGMMLPKIKMGDFVGTLKRTKKPRPASTGAAFGWS